MESGILDQLRNMSRGDQSAFNGWLKANATIGLILLTALIAMALVGSKPAKPDETAVANDTKSPGVSTAVAAGSTAAAPQADEAASEPLYPGRHNAICKPAPMLGCLCETNAGQVSIFPQLASDDGDSIDPVRDVEYLRLVEWLRLTCQRVVNSR